MSGGVDIAGLRETIRETLVREWRDDYSVASIVDALTAAVTNLNPAPVMGETTDAGEGECCQNYPHAAHETPCTPATPDADDASEIEAIAHTLRAAWGIDNAELAGLVEWIFAYTSTRVSAAATRAADDRAERIAQAIEGVATYTVHEAPAHGGYSRQGVSPESVRRTAATIARTTP